MLGYVGCLFNSNVNQRQLTSKQLNMLEVIFPYTSYKPCMIWTENLKIWLVWKCVTLQVNGRDSKLFPTKWHGP